MKLVRMLASVCSESDVAPLLSAGLGLLPSSSIEENLFPNLKDFGVGGGWCWKPRGTLLFALENGLFLSMKLQIAFGSFFFLFME